MAGTPLSLRWALVNLFLTAAAAGLTLFIWMAESDVRTQLAKVRQRTQAGCPAKRAPKPPPPPPVAVEEPVVAPPPEEDEPKSGYIGDRGTDITPTMRLQLEGIRGAGAEIELLRLGAHTVLPPGTIHVVNLWATWCEPCKAEMPDFKAMFDRHADWGASVQFVPVLVKDAAEPVRAYAGFAETMPATNVKLADRAMSDPLTTALASDESLELFRGNLPVTLVLDCNRRVRWARFEQLGEADFAELEKFIEQFRAELAETGEDAWCRQEWQGNGRCEPRELTAAGHSFEDCGELKVVRRPTTDPSTTATEPATPTAECPAGQVRGADGQCAAKPRDTTPTGPTRTVTDRPGRTTISTMMCGDGRCEPMRGESKVTCCQDCPCSAPLSCRPAGNETHSCQAGLK